MSNAFNLQNTLHVLEIGQLKRFVSDIQKSGNIVVYGVAHVDCSGLGILFIKLKGNFKIRFLQNAQAIVHGRHQTFLVSVTVAKRNVNVQKG